MSEDSKIMWETEAVMIWPLLAICVIVAACYFTIGL